jgi:NADH-quinone oxidoreductase subunit N
MVTISYANLLSLVIPETILVIAAFIVLAVDLLPLRDKGIPYRFAVGALISCLGCAAAILSILAGPHQANILGGMLLINPIIQLIQIALLILATLTICLSCSSTFTNHIGEYLLLLLLATSAMLFLVSTQDILLIFISLELLSLSLYTLTAFNKRNIKSAEAAMKYFLYGGMSAAFLLFGLSFLYGTSGSTNLREIALSTRGSTLDPLIMVASVTTMIGFGFKVAAVPFHLWAPDAYEGAPTPSAAFIASSSKVASFFIFAQVMMIGFANAQGSASGHQHATGWAMTIALVAVVSMVLGNLVAIVQTSVRRLLAYSAIAHAGYLLLGIMAQTRQSIAGLIYYVVTYALTTVGAFGVVSVVEQATGSDRLASFAGFRGRAPLVSFCMLVFLLSLAGIPPLAGFFGKFYLFTAALSSGSASSSIFWLVVLAVAMSAVSLYYYLQVLKRIYVESPPEANETIQVPLLDQCILFLVALSVIILGCAPGLLLNPIQRAAPSLTFLKMSYHTARDLCAGLLWQIKVRPYITSLLKKTIMVALIDSSVREVFFIN